MKRTELAELAYAFAERDDFEVLTHPEMRVAYEAGFRAALEYVRRNVKTDFVLDDLAAISCEMFHAVCAIEEDK